MNLEQKKDRLLEYAAQLGRLERKCEEVARWDSLAEAGEPDSSNNIKVTAIQIRSECEVLAKNVQALRSRLVAALNCLRDARQREVLELYYLNTSTTHDIQLAKGWSSRYIRQLRTKAIQSLEEASDFFFID